MATDVPANSVRMDSVELVRGLAALAVCLFHFTKYVWPDESIVRQVCSYGWTGVESFFVISGFIIPFAMARANYRYSCFIRFLTKRYVRLAPPYVCAILLALVLWFLGSLVPGFRGEPFQFQGGRIAAHFFFANDLLYLPWLNPVFWTLAIEFQYYVAIGLLFPFLFTGSEFRNVVAVVVLTLCALPPSPQALVSHWVLIFLTGIVLAQWRLNRISLWSAVSIESVLLCIIWQHHGIVILIASALTLAVIVFTRKVPAWGFWLGKISYSLYLVHVPIGGRIVNLGNRYADGEIGRWCVFAAAMASSVLAAWLLWFTVERASIAWSSRIKYFRAPVNKM